MIKKIYFFLLIIAGGIFFSTGVSALTISPAKGLITIERGAKQVVSVNVFNESNNNIAIETAVVGVNQDNNGLPIFDSNTEEAKGWVYAPTGIFNLKSGETKKVEFTVSVPPTAYPGSHYLGLGIKSVSGAGQIGVSGQLISLLTVQVAGIAQENLRIESWSPKSLINFNKNLVFNLKLRNRGNVELPVFGQFELSYFWKKAISKKDLYLGNKIFVGSVRDTVSQFNLENDIKWPGVYQAKVIVDYGLTHQQTQKVKSFIYLPVWSAVVLAGLFLFIIFTKLIFRKKVKNEN